MNRRNMNQSTSCPKAGIKIYETNNRQQPAINVQPSANINMQSRLSKPVSFQNTTLNSLDLDLENYSLEDLYHLFNIDDGYLTETSLKNAKQIVLKMHPDKSQLDAKYFIFFSGAYKRLYGIYEFQNKSTNKKNKDEDFFDESNRNILNNMFEKNKDFKDTGKYNDWFNQMFEKHRVDNPIEQGYGDWLKSDEGIMCSEKNVTQGNMNELIERKKRDMQTVSVYTGINDLYASTFGASMLDGSGDLTTDSYTDLRQAYTETLIPVTEDDYNKVQKFNSVSEYKAHREKVDVTPISKAEAERKLYQQQRDADKHSAALAFKFAQESEKAKQKQQGFWSDLKQLTGW